MDLTDYKNSLTEPVRQVTLVYLVKDDEVLLAMKKRGFGEGKWNGVGGKPEDGESIEDAAKREAFEEINVKPLNLKNTAIITFYTPHKPEWNQQMIVYEVDKWEGKPKETEEMAPQWFDKDKVPYSDMWPDDIIWFPLALSGKFVDADFLFDEQMQIKEHKINSPE